MRYDPQVGIILGLRFLDSIAFIIAAAVHEAAAWLEMAMNITKYIYWSLLFYDVGKMPHSVNHRMQPGRRLSPASVVIRAMQVSPMITLNNPIRIQNWYDLKYVLFS